MLLRALSPFIAFHHAVGFGESGERLDGVLLLAVDVAHGDQIFIILITFRIAAQDAKRMVGPIGLSQGEVSVGERDRDRSFVRAFFSCALQILFRELEFLD